MDGLRLKKDGAIEYPYKVKDLRKVLAQVERITLSLKSIYRLLMNDDFPVYSDRVIGKKQRKGQTLLRFWKDIMAHEFCSLPYGKMIWRDDGMRSRSFSNLCNRNDELKIYHEYARELGSCISADTLLHQIDLFERFLTAREYSDAALRYRTGAFLRVLHDDECVTGAIGGHLAGIFEALSSNTDAEPELAAFRAAYLLTVMTLYAAAGTAMGDSCMAVLRDDALGMDALWALRTQKQTQGNREVRILTAYSALLQDTSLSRNRFFGREAELFDLQDLAASGQKCLISGIGGIGKTELLRQLVRRCLEERLVDKLAIIPYRTSLAESMVYAFPDLMMLKQDEALHSALYRLRREAQDGTLLLLIDNVTNDADADAGLLSLAELPCTVMATSRLSALSGFEPYPLGAPAPDACALIFRDNYGSPLSVAERGELSQLLSRPDFCHPLTLRLMARAAGSKDWTVGALRESLLHDAALTYVEDGQQVRIEQVLARLYPANRIPKGCETVIQLFTLLPRDSYPADTLLTDFPQLFPDRDELARNLALLVRQGWLEQDESGCSMHPLIAQCLRRKTLPESYLAPFLSNLRPRLSGADREFSAECRRAVAIIPYSLQFLTGPISGALLMDLMDAMDMQVPFQSQREQYCQWLKQLLRRCPDRDDTVDVSWHGLLCNWVMDEEETVRAVFDKQRQARTVPLDRYLEFCHAASSQLAFKNPALSERLAQAVLAEADAPAVNKVRAYLRLAQCAEFAGHAEEALHLARTSLQYSQDPPLCCGREALVSSAFCATLCIKFGQGEEAKPLLDRLGTIDTLSMYPDLYWEYLFALGTWELYFGDMDNARKAYEQALQSAEELTGKNPAYFDCLNQLAIIAQRQNRFDDAKAAYEEILDERSGHVYGNVARNNYAVLLLDMGQPEEALHVIAQVLAIAREHGGIALGEALRNKARAHGMLGDNAQERECLTEALPLLEQAYGPEHPRPTAARERLAQLREQEAQAEQPLSP